MNRREVLSAISGSFSLFVTGCIGSSPGSERTTTHDPFPDDVGRAKRGGADEPLTVAVQESDGYSDGSLACAEKAHESFRNHLGEKIDLSGLISTGYGKGPEGYDGMAVFANLVTKKHDRNGDVIQTAKTEYPTLLKATPPTIYLVSESGEQVCAVPVYVEKSRSHLD
jgi:hypothetical protein